MSGVSSLRGLSPKPTLQKKSSSRSLSRSTGTTESDDDVSDAGEANGIGRIVGTGGNERGYDEQHYTNQADEAHKKQLIENDKVRTVSGLELSRSIANVSPGLKRAKSVDSYLSAQSPGQGSISRQSQLTAPHALKVLTKSRSVENLVGARPDWKDKVSVSGSFKP